MTWLMQDECKPLSVWLSTRLGDYREIRRVKGSTTYETKHVIAFKSDVVKFIRETEAKLRKKNT
jgi:hypothetical protein